MNNLSEINVPPSKLIVDVDNVYTLPKRFRTTLDDLDAENKELPNNLGLRELKVSGSGVFSQKGLQKMKNVIEHDQIIIVDTRKESHGYVNGMAVSWYGEKNYINKNLTSDEVQIIEQSKLDELKKTDEIKFDFWEGKSVPMKEPIKPKNVLSAEELAKEEGVGYIRFFVTDHNKPDDEEIDKFIDFVRALSGDEWLHIHCRGGVGRTTSFMIMFDMLRNVNEVSCEDILERQKLIGGRDMKRLAEGTYKYEAAVERLELIEKFYQYCKENNSNNYTISWSEWIRS